MSRIAQLQKLLAMDPADIELHYMMAMEYKSAGDHATAYAKFDDCIRMNSHYAPAYFHKANTYLAAGESEQAKSTLRLGIQKAAEGGDSHAAAEMTELLNTLL